MKGFVSVILCVLLLQTPCLGLEPLSGEDIAIDAPSACLLEKTTGEIIYEKDAHSRRHIASVTKVMTLLLIMEAIESGQLAWDTNIVASAHAAGMGGSQIWLEEGETMTAEEMIKCVTVVSANDCSVAMAEHLCGTEEAFTAKMNERAAELGLENTRFTNCTGLFDHDDHYSSAHDVAIMARELIRHDAIKSYSTIWMDTARNGEFGLSNTNKLIHSYDGATGLKTGFTDGAMYCLAATAQRDGVEYVAAVLGADSSAARFDSAKTLLSYAFANYTLSNLSAAAALPPIPVELGQADFVRPMYSGTTHILLQRSGANTLRYEPSLPDFVTAPVQEGDALGTVTVYMGDTVLATLPVTAHCDVPALDVGGIWQLLWEMLLCR